MKRKIQPRKISIKGILLQMLSDIHSPHVKRRDRYRITNQFILTGANLVRDLIERDYKHLITEYKKDLQNRIKIIENANKVLKENDKRISPAVLVAELKSLDKKGIFEYWREKTFEDIGDWWDSSPIVRRKYFDYILNALLEKKILNIGESVEVFPTAITLPESDLIKKEEG